MAWTRRRMWLVLSACILLPVAGFGSYLGWWYLNTRSMSAACDCGEDPLDGERMALWNPFRDHGPEIAAQQMLRAVQSGNCQSIPAMREYCERENRFKIVSWKLTGRSSDGTGSNLRFWVIRTYQHRETFGDPIWIEIERDPPAWKVTSVSLYY